MKSVRRLINKVSGNHDLAFFLGTTSTFIFYFFDKNPKDVVGNGIWTIVIAVLLSSPIGLIPLLYLIASVKFDLMGSGLKPEFTFNLFILVCLLIGYVQWFGWTSKKPMVLKFRYYYIRIIFCLSLIPLFLNLLPISIKIKVLEFMVGVG